MVQCPDAVRTKIIAALVEGNFGALFPDKECGMAIRAKETRLGFTEPVVNLKKMATDFAAQLGFNDAVIEVKVVMGCVAKRTNRKFRNG